MWSRFLCNHNILLTFSRGHKVKWRQNTEHQANTSDQRFSFRFNNESTVSSFNFLVKCLRIFILFFLILCCDTASQGDQLSTEFYILTGKNFIKRRRWRWWVIREWFEPFFSVMCGFVRLIQRQEDQRWNFGSWKLL